VLLLRCAWHSRFHGYPRLIAVASWRGFRLQFTDGICPRCASRVMGDSTPPDPPSKKARRPGGDRAAVLIVGVPLAAALVLAASPLSEPPSPRDVDPLSEAPSLGKTAPVSEPRALTGAAALPSRVLRPEPRVAPPPTAVVTPRTRGGVRGAAAVRARAPLSIRSIVRIADGVERIEIQAP
jgi:hypothetical protein